MLNVLIHEKMMGSSLACMSFFALGGIIGVLYGVLQLFVLIGLVVLAWNAYVALRIYIKKNSDVNWKGKD